MTEWYRMRDGYFNKHGSPELSVETSCEMSDSYNYFKDNLSPIEAPIVPRKLDFGSLDDEDEGVKSGDLATHPAGYSPPYKRVRALRLSDSPLTPRSLLEKCSTPTHHPPRSRLFPPKINVQSVTPSGSSHHLHPPSGDEDSAIGSLPPDVNDELRLTLPRQIANINPFTPDGQALNKKKRALSKTPTWDNSPEHPAKRLRESDISRYNVEFVEVGPIGRGQFGMVTKCINKLDGCVYAVKRSLKPLNGSGVEKSALNEVYAHAVLGKHPHVVRYYSAWSEDGHMVIQNEYCDGGSLQQKLEQDGPLSETDLLLLLAHVADGLAYIHSQNIVHMDLKPGNIFICLGEGERTLDSDDGYDDDEPRPTHKYKIGDLGHITCVSSPSVEEGDCRYLPKEVLREDFTHLPKADIFSFGLTLFEAAGGGPLPKNGQLWHDYRDGNLPNLPNLSREFNQLLKRMTDPDASQRPSAQQLRREPILGAGNKSRAQLRRELHAARCRNELLLRELHDARRYIKALTPTLVNNESAKFRTRSAKRLKKPCADSPVKQSVTNRRTSTRTKKI